ncbi:uncharacterized protein MONBRDRAFT_11214 [Monosiga brevicollis MX1]|uniref:Amine oxidase domain-containing protein n=1 Tax=Monosiga brevicollis TaxID=81824 RepID=A9V8J7_MONBE|nr:uncharacterized protein MONBRDRAFT_11214 [Monosiga brevicollis MX1]EDQ86156.1 predicted protein [Monosiga brevicollis MX1]|eukprot:XP_001749081.1 hypothetical protein [Monosiga brevicollis MX1]
MVIPWGRPGLDGVLLKHACLVSAVIVPFGLVLAKLRERAKAYQLELLARAEEPEPVPVPVPAGHDSATRAHGPRIVILGGGISGLSAAFLLKARQPDAHVTILEASSRLGGNMHTHALQLPDKDGSAHHIELGPRSLRTTTPAAKAALQMMLALGLGDKLTFAERTTRGRRYVYNFDRRGLLELPSSFLAFLKFAFEYNLPLCLARDVAHFGASLWAALCNRSNHTARVRALNDMTVDSFFRTHFSDRIAAELGSALVRGIFSGSSTNLLLKHAFPSLWQLVAAYDSVVVGALLNPFLHLSDHFALQPELHIPTAGVDPTTASELLARARRERVASVQGGLSTIIDTLADRLRAQGVVIRTNVVAHALLSSMDNPNQAAVLCASAHEPAGPWEQLDATDIIATLPPPALASLIEQTLELDTQPSSQAPRPTRTLPDGFEPAFTAPRLAWRARGAATALRRMPSLSLATVTLVYQNQSFGNLVHRADAQPGFGMLIPEGGLGHPKPTLGVVYDSLVFPELAGRQHTVLTCMFGGADPAAQARVTGMPSSELADVAQQEVNRLLGVKAVPSLCVPTLWRDAIPQFTKAYDRARAQVEEDFLGPHLPWLQITGKAFGTGVGVNDCIYSAMRTAEQTLARWHDRAAHA